MTTGTFWNLKNPTKPVGLLDIDGVYDIPVDWSDWLSSIGDTYASHVFVMGAGLVNIFSNESAGVITIRVKVDPDASVAVGTTCSFTCRITTTGGQVEDQTLYLKIVEK
jgi:hypothetical protein